MFNSRYIQQAQEDDTSNSVREEEQVQSGSTHPTPQEEQSTESSDPPLHQENGFTPTGTGQPWNKL